MIIGLGTDIIQIPRIESVLQRFGQKFIQKIYTDYEISQAKKFSCPKKVSAHYAKRFAAKEAFVKALGTGFINNIHFTDIEVRSDALNKPYLQLSNQALYSLNLLRPDHLLNTHLSLSDDYPAAMAVVIITANINL